MADPKHTSFTELQNLLDHDFVAYKKIECIKLLRGLSGEGLKETKDFFEQVWQPKILENKDVSYDPSGSVNHGSLINVCVEPENEPATIAPPMFLVGHTYKQLDKSVVLILGVSNPNTSYETVYSMDSDGSVIHRYNRRDFGRVTGTDFEIPDPRNLETI